MPSKIKLTNPENQIKKQKIFKTKKAKAEVFQGIGLGLAVIGGVFSVLGFLNWSEVQKFKKEGLIARATVIKKYRNKSSIIGRRRALRNRYRVDVYYWDKKITSPQEKIIADREFKTSTKKFALSNKTTDNLGKKELGNWQTGTIEKMTKKQFKAIAENTKIDIYYLQDRSAKVALKNWVDNYNVISSYGLALIFILPGTTLFVSGTKIIARAKKINNYRKQ